MHWTVYLLLSFSTVSCRDAIRFFAKHKIVKNLTITKIPTLENSYSYWIEYKYYFGRNKLMMDNLKIGYISNAANSLEENIFREVVDTLNQFKIRSEDILLDENKAMRDLISKNIDLVANYPHIDDHGIQQLYPLVKSNYLLIFKSNKLNFTKDVFILTFAGTLWLAFIATLLIAAFCLRISTKQYSRIHPRDEAWSWVEITLWAIAAACQQGLSHTPSGFSSCLIFLLGYLTTYLLYTAFAAEITSVLVQQDSYYNFDLRNYKSNLKLVYLGAPNLNQTFVTTISANNVSSFFRKLDTKTYIGVGPEILLNDYLASQDVTKFVVKKLDAEYRQSFVAYKNNCKAASINKILIRMDEVGVLKRIQNKILKPIGSFSTDSNYSSAGREHVGSAILLYLGGVTMSLIFLWTEWMVTLYKKSRQELGL